VTAPAPDPRHHYPGTLLTPAAGDRVHVWAGRVYAVGTVTSVDAAGMLTVVEGDTIHACQVADVISVDPLVMHYRDRRSDLADGARFVGAFLAAVALMAIAVVTATTAAWLAWRTLP
jgi:hypothetical protein